MLFKYWQTYLNTQASSKSHKKNKKKKKEIERNETHAMKLNKRWRANTYHAMTLFIILICNKEKAHKIFPELATENVL